jgi:hypothetical protein
LQHHPCMSFENAWIVEGTLHATYQEAVTLLGLFADDNKVVYAIQEAIYNLCTPQQLWVLFVHLLVNDCVPTPLTIWHHFCNNLTWLHITVR